MENDTEAIASATWTMDQVRQVRGLYCVLAIDEMLIERDGEVVFQAAREKLAKRIVHDAHPFGVEVHPSDVDFQYERRPESPMQVFTRARWEPTTNRVELRGGAIDGKTVAVQKVGDPILVSALDQSPWIGGSGVPTATIEPRILRYELVGWSERDRHWVYQLTS